MSSELRIKKLRGSGGYIMASVDDEQQTKGNLGGPDLFLAPIGRLNTDLVRQDFPSFVVHHSTWTTPFGPKVNEDGNIRIDYIYFP